jgi:hypothetical protein
MNRNRLCFAMIFISLIFMSCRGVNMTITQDPIECLITNKYVDQLFLETLGGSTNRQRKPLLDLTDLNGAMIRRAGFIRGEGLISQGSAPRPLIYVWYQENDKGARNKIYSLKIYDAQSNRWDLLLQKEFDWGEMRPISVSLSDCYFCLSTEKNKLRKINIATGIEESLALFESSEAIINIEQNVLENEILVNTINNNQNKHYFIDRHSGNIISQGDGFMYRNKDHSEIEIKKEGGDVYFYNKSKNESRKIEINIDRKYAFYFAYPPLSTLKCNTPPPLRGWGVKKRQNPYDGVNTTPHQKE